MMKNLKYFIPSAVLLSFLALFVGTARANPSFFGAQAKTSTSTTTPTFQTPGTASSTVVYDSYGINGSNQVTTSGGKAQTISTSDTAELLVQFTASSTSSKLNINVEYSDDGFDWYQNTFTNVPGYATTTTVQFFVNTIPQFTWPFASSTPGLGALSPSNNLDTRAFQIPVPTRFARAIITCGLGGTNCAAWAQWVPKKQTP